MPTLREILGARLAKAVEAAGFTDFQAEVSQAADTRYGDYQANAAMALARKERKNPREVAAAIIAHLDVSDISAPAEVAGAGFINFRILPEFSQQRLQELLKDDAMGVTPTSSPKTIIIDYSSPNVAKPMHVGHIRSTILGDCLSRIARFLGHKVITDNHIGDWGTQFGKVIYGWKNFLDRDALAKDAIAELVRLYRTVNELEKTDEAVARQAREELVKLQQGDAENLAIWKDCVECSWAEFQKLYDLLGIRFDERLGESSYNDALGPICERLQQQGIAEISDGALCVFLRDIPALAEKPAIIRKADGGFLYATTDLATIEYRMERWHPDAIWYVVGAPQALHFQQIFGIAHLLGVKADLQHIAFGSILGEDRKIMKTRSGENVGLADVLTEAISRARTLVAEKNPDLPEDERESIAHHVGLGAVKYAELSQHRMTDYVFSWDKMLSFQGNTAPYLQNAYVRIRSIFRKAGEAAAQGDIVLGTPEERALGIKLQQYAETVPAILDDFRPNLLANYLYELANAFHSFYEACPVLKAEDAVRQSRLALCDLTARTLAHGLGLLGIVCPEKM